MVQNAYNANKGKRPNSNGLNRPNSPVMAIMSKQEINPEYLSEHILCTQMPSLMNNPGNHYFKKLIEEYLTEPKKGRVEKIYDFLKTQGINFVAQNPLTQKWYISDKATAFEKISSALQNYESAGDDISTTSTVSAEIVDSDTEALEQVQIKNISQIPVQIEAEKLLRSAKNKREKKWYEQFIALCEYKKEHKNCKVPRIFLYNKLANWVKVQREEYKVYQKGEHSCMTPERIAMLDQLGFHWSRA